MVTIFHKTIKDTEPKVLKESKTGVWVCLEEPTESEVTAVAKAHALDASLIKDALDLYEVPRIEREDGVLYVYTRVPFQEGTSVMTVPLLIALTGSAVITVSMRQLPVFAKFKEGKLPFTTTQRIKLFLQFFTEINASYSRFLTNMSRRVRAASVQLESITNRHVVQLVSFENILNDFLAALVPTSALLNTLLSGKTLKLYATDEDLVEDIFLTNGQLIELAKSNLKTIVNVREAYSTIMGNNLNQVLKLLTSLTILMTVPMIISSFFGMNVALPFAQSPYAFAGIVSITLLITLIIFLIFNRNRWL
ncbi:MAG TPA: magnesium transporter CorA family protein [Patescibacteria group bacterium]